jgi:hypothetical protein
VEFITQLYLVPGLRMNGIVPLLPYTPSRRAKRKRCFLFSLEFNNDNNA